MIKNLKKSIFFVILFFSFIFNINAYTKEEVISLASSINVCSGESISMVNGIKTTYTRLLNERDVSSENLNKIYNNISYVKNVLSSYNVCSRDELSTLPSGVKDELYSLYKQTNKLITSSPRYVDKVENNSDIKENKNNTDNKSSDNTSTDVKIKTASGEIKIVIDSSAKELKIYESDILIDVVGNIDELNYVGLNKTIIISLIIMLIVLISMIVLKLFKVKSIIVTSIIYVILILLPLTFIYKDKISMVLDTLYNMSVKPSNIEKQIVVKDNKIISYPSYNSKYATIYINDNSGDVYFGDSSYILSKGVGHSTQTPLPGEDGTTVLSGHNTGIFNELFNLKNNDKVVIDTVYGKFNYKVVDKKIVEDTDIESVVEDYDLVLYTCYPNSSLYGSKRLVVYLNIISSEWLGEDNEN